MKVIIIEENRGEAIFKMIGEVFHLQIIREIRLTRIARNPMLDGKNLVQLNVVVKGMKIEVDLDQLLILPRGEGTINVAILLVPVEIIAKKIQITKL